MTTPNPTPDKPKDPDTQTDGGYHNDNEPVDTPPVVPAPVNP